MSREPEETFFQRRPPGQQAHEKMLDIPIIRKMQIKTTRYLLIPVRMAIIKKATTNKYWQG